MTTLKFKDGTTLNPIEIDGQRSYVQTSTLYQGMNRDSLQFYFKKADYTFDQLNALFGDKAKLEELVISYPEVSQNAEGTPTTTEKSVSYNDYVLLVSIGLKGIEVASSTVNTPSVVEEMWVATVAQLTFLEKNQANQQAVIDALLITIAQ